MVNKPTQISESLIDHVYTKKSLKRNHDAVRIITEKTANDFYTIQLNLIWSEKKEEFVSFLDLS